MTKRTLSNLGREMKEAYEAAGLDPVAVQKSLEEIPGAWEEKEIPDIPMFNHSLSSNIEALGFQRASEEAITGTLAIKFKSGGLYHYENFPDDMYRDLCAADSVGKFFHMHVRGKFSGERVG